MASLLFKGYDVTEAGDTPAPSSKLTVTFDDTGTGTSTFTLGFLDLTNDTKVTIDSNRASTVTGGSNTVGQLAEVNNDLAKLTITGSVPFNLGSNVATGSNLGDGVVTDTGATASSPTTIKSSLNLIDASATTGGVGIFAGATNTSSGGDFASGASLNADVTITYTGLTIKGGSGNDFIENDAKKGVVIDGDGQDHVILGGAGATATLGGGAGDIVQVGFSDLGTNETAGSALGDTVKFGFAEGAILSVGVGAEAGSSGGLTKVLGATAGLQINFTNIITSSTNIVDETTAVASATNLKTAENDAVAALAGPGVAYFNYGGNEYFIATNLTEVSISSHDAIVKLVGVTGLIGSGTTTDVELLSHS